MHKQIEQQIQEIQFLEQASQSILMQKQAFQIEFDETIKSLESVKDSKGEVYKIVGQLMIKTPSEDVVSELTKKKEIVELRLKNLEQQEEKMMQKMDELRNAISSTSSKNS